MTIIMSDACTLIVLLELKWVGQNGYRKWRSKLWRYSGNPRVVVYDHNFLIIQVRRNYSSLGEGALCVMQLILAFS